MSISGETALRRAGLCSQIQHSATQQGKSLNLTEQNPDCLLSTPKNKLGLEQSPKNPSSLSSAAASCLCFICTPKVKWLCCAAMPACTKHKVLPPALMIRDDELPPPSATCLLHFWVLGAPPAACRLPPSPPS